MKTGLPSEKELSNVVSTYLERWDSQDYTSDVALFLMDFAPILRMYACLDEKNDFFYLIYEDFVAGVDSYPKKEVLNYLPCQFQFPFDLIQERQKDKQKHLELCAHWERLHDKAAGMRALNKPENQQAEGDAMNAFLDGDTLDRTTFCHHFRWLMECYKPEAWNGFIEGTLNNNSFRTGWDDAERVVQAGASQLSYNGFNLFVKRFFLWWNLLGYDNSLFSWKEIENTYPALSKMSEVGLASLLFELERRVLQLDVRQLIQAGVIEEIPNDDFDTPSF